MEVTKLSLLSMYQSRIQTCASSKIIWQYKYNVRAITYKEEIERIIIADSERIEIFLYARQLNDLP